MEEPSKTDSMSAVALQYLEDIFNFVRCKLSEALASCAVIMDGRGESDSGILESLLSHWCFCLFCLLVVLCIGYRCIYVPFFHDFLLAEKCRIKLENVEPLKVGDNVVHIITGFMNGLPFDLDEKKLRKRAKKFFNALTAKVTLNEVRVPAMKAFAEEDFESLRLIFIAEKSGTYRMELRFNGFLIPGSPVEITVPPDFMCPLETDVVFPSQPVVITDGMPQILEILPKDRTGYPCSWEGVHLDKFDFHSSESAGCDPSLCGKMIGLVGDYWKEGICASYSYDGSSVGEDRTNQPIKVLLTLRSNRAPNSRGIFEGQICYDGQIIKNGCFPMVSISPDEYERLEPSLKEPRPTDVIQLRAQLLESVECGIDEPHRKNLFEWCLPGAGNMVRDFINPPSTSVKMKEVFVNVSLRFICVKEVVWTVLLARTALFPIHGDIKIEAIPERESQHRYYVTIVDTAQHQSVRLLMSAGNARMLMALFLKFRGGYQGGGLTFIDKLSHFFQRVKDHAVTLAELTKGQFQLIHVSRPDILRTSYEETKHFEKSNWYNPFVVSFLGEPLSEDPNSKAWQEWSHFILEAILENNPDGMFHIISEKSGLVHPNPSRHHRRWCVQLYELAGKLIGKYLVERSLDPTYLNCGVKTRFSRSFLLQLIGSPPTASSLERDMPELFDSTLKSLNRNNQQEDGLGHLTFTVPLYDTFGKLDQLVPIIEDGEHIQVTNENAYLYLNALARYHLASKVSREIKAFRSGLTYVIPEDFLLNFDENELELLLCGWSKLDIGEVKENHKEMGEFWHPEFPRIMKWFWNSLSGMSSVDQARFLQFCTGSSILPEGGFKKLAPPLKLSMTCIYGQLPVADPASHHICLSDHPTYESFDEALLTALRTSSCCQDKPQQVKCSHGSDEGNHENESNHNDTSTPAQ